ncbi:MAG TPA: potassium transporter [Verrucomicrobia bacterium]|nr:potassium transporter [Verrucomicrobiota bacterium]
MKFRSVLHLVSYLMIAIGLAIWFCAGVSWHYHDPSDSIYALFLGGAIGVLLGGGTLMLTRGEISLSRRDGFGVVTFGWLALTLIGSVPYIASGVITNPVSAMFETVSGFTTTGASVLGDLEALPRGILFWRALTQWFGGMGVLVLCVAILPFLGVGGMQVYRAEMPGPSKDRLTPRIATTAKLLWGLYALMSLVQAVLLMVGGMDWFDACCHTFATMSTGGFSTRTASVAAFDSAFADVVITVFMFLAGASFSLHFRALRGAPGVFWRDPEFRFYTGLWVLSSLFLSGNIWMHGIEPVGGALRHGFFQGTSILTTTGFATRDYNLWPQASRLLLVLLMFSGGCGGSTAGGIKVVRFVVVFKHIARELGRVMRPQSVARIKLGREVLDESVVANILTFVMLFSAIFASMSFLMTFYTPDLETATSAVVASLGNIGPGIASVGPMETYAFIPDPGKLILIVCMLLGRLELYTVLLLFLPSFWRR